MVCITIPGTLEQWGYLPTGLQGGSDMRASWGVTVTVGALVALSLCSSGAWLYPNSFYSASGSSSSWHWLEGNQHYAGYQFQRLPTERSALLLEVLVMAPVRAGAALPSTQAVRVQVRATGGSWTSHRVILHMTQDRGSDCLYQGHLLLSRRALQIGTNLDVRLEPISWNQELGVYEGSVRIRAPLDWQHTESVIALASSASATAGVGGPLNVADFAGSAAHSGTLTASPDNDRLSYLLPLSVRQWVRLEVEFTGGSGCLQLVSPAGRTVAMVEGAGKLDLSYRTHVSGTWSVLLDRESGREVRYTLRMETSGR